MGIVLEENDANLTTLSRAKIKSGVQIYVFMVRTGTTLLCNIFFTLVLQAIFRIT